MSVVSDPGSVNSSRRPSNASSTFNSFNNNKSNNASNENPLVNLRKVSGFAEFENSQSLPLEQLDHDIITVGAATDYDDILTIIKYIVSKDKYALQESTLPFLADACFVIRSKTANPEHFAGLSDIANRLLDLGVNVNIPDRKGYTPLMHAVCTYDTNLVKRLIELGADLNSIVPKLNASALMRLCDNGQHMSRSIYGIEKYAKHALLLIENGADISIRDIYNRDAMIHAKETDEFLKTYIVRSDYTSGSPGVRLYPDGNTPFAAVVKALQKRLNANAGAAKANAVAKRVKGNENARKNAAGTRREERRKVAFEPIQARFGGKRRTKRARRSKCKSRI